MQCPKSVLFKIFVALKVYPSISVLLGCGMVQHLWRLHSRRVLPGPKTCAAHQMCCAVYVLPSLCAAQDMC